MNLTQRQRRLVQWAGYPLLALVVFLFAVQLTFPYERVKDKLVELLSQKYDVSIVSVEPSLLPGGLILKTVVLQTRPTLPSEEPTILLIDRLRVDVGLWALLRGRADVNIVADIGGGRIEGKVAVAPQALALNVATEGLPLETVPVLRAAVGLPMKGGLDASLAVTLPEQRWDLAKGSITLACSGCTIGDGQAKIKPRSPAGARGGRTAAFASQGMTVPELKLGTLTGQIDIAEGRGIVEQLTARSDDGDLVINGAIRFGRDFKDARFEQGCMKFRLSDELKQREPSFGNLPNLMGVPPQSDGYANVMMQGQLTAMRWLPAMSCEEDGSSERLSARRSARPTISARTNLNEQPSEPMEIEGAFQQGRMDRGEEGRGDGEREPIEELAAPPPSAPKPAPESRSARGDFPSGITPVPRPAGAARTVGQYRVDDVEPASRRPMAPVIYEEFEDSFEHEDDGEHDEAAAARRRGGEREDHGFGEDEDGMEDYEELE